MNEPQTRVLIVDDEPAIRMLLQELLGAEGFHCRQAETVEQAIARLAGDSYHLVLSDLRMPGMDGFDLLRHIKDREEETGVVMVSAVDDIDTAVQLLREGAYDYLVKPFRPDDVLERVRAAAERVQLTRQNRRYSLHLRDEVERRTEELRSMQDHLRRSEEIRRLLMEQAGEAFLTLDAETGEILEANTMAEELLDASRGALGGRRLAELGSGEGPRLLLEEAGDKPIHQRLELRSLEGVCVPSHVTASRIESPDGPLLFLVLRRDEEHQWFRVLGTLSHELRTPLTSVLGHAEIVEALGGVRTGPAGESIRTIRSNARHCLRMVEDLLDVALREGRKAPLRREPCDPASLLHQALQTLAPLARDKKLALEVQADRNLPVVKADGDQLHRILLNLGGNALHYTHRGGVRIRAFWREGALHLRVADTGVGIAPEDRERIFLEGERGDHQTVAGAGIGLAVARRLAREMGGDISIWSRYGLGSVFTARLPLPTLTEHGSVSSRSDGTGTRETDAGLAESA